MKFQLLIILLLASMAQLCAQTTNDPKVEKRVLFVLDGSGSMTKEWGSDTKFEIAKKMLYQLADSIAAEDASIELGVRIFGHQSPRIENNCTDSKLEIPFSPSFDVDFHTTLEQVTPQGHTPIAYSLLQSVNDFPDEEHVINSIILITDGIENCDGNPCEASELLQLKRITINPFIIGLDIGEEEAANFDCIGTFLNAKDETTFEQMLQQTVQKATNETTVEINLKSAKGSNISNTAISLIDSYSGKYIYNFIHAITKKGNSDTITIDPRGVYAIQVHTKPDMFVKGVVLVAGEHNIIDIPIRKGFLVFNHKPRYDEQAAQYVIAQDENNQLLFANTLRNEQFLEGKYRIANTFLPMQQQTDAAIPLEVVVAQNIPTNGRLSIENDKKIRASIFQKQNGVYQMVYDFGLVSGHQQINLQPGAYFLLYIHENERNSEESARHNFTIVSDKTSVVNIK